MGDFIKEYLQTLHSNITDRIDGDFLALQARVKEMDDNLTNMETEIERQLSDVSTIIDTRQANTQNELKLANNLLINVEQAHISSYNNIVERMETLVKNV